ncbi:LacI family DNA-binding transcriptional regulator [Vibrio viridaestus]|uniref:LacI family transcriptional regulator n=1 Tax=Vibrio viridaestus TaxID=2487322 RepID=A0A3N9TED8_9VIBR|nr:LacI family DNA-binding transcriptional regulator [Vibrio viridaestus]RQW62063.1 LacI family transcriptional regulator [Vibrio viridaestus]
MATIKDVAKRANVSTATVSRVINNHPSVTPFTREVVHKAMDELCYLPTKSSIQLTGKKSGLLGVLVPNVSNPHFNELVMTLEQEARYYGMNLIIKTHQNDIGVEKSAIEAFISLGIEGLFWVPTENEFTLVELLNRSGIYTVVVTQRSKFFDSVLVDYRIGAFLAAQHFFELGYTNIGFIGQKSVDYEKFSVFNQYISQKGIEIEESNIIWVKKGLGENILDPSSLVSDVIEKAIKKQNSHVAFWVYNDVFAVRLVKEIQAMSKAIPEDVSIISFDDTYLAHLMDITSVTQPIREIARIAYCRIQERRNNNEIECIEISPRITPRKSTLKFKVTTMYKE